MVRFDEENTEATNARVFFCNHEIVLKDPRPNTSEKKLSPRRLKIMITRRGLAGLGKDTVRRVHFWVFSTSHFAPTALSSEVVIIQEVAIAPVSDGPG